MSEYAVIEKSTDVVVQCTCAGSESDALLPMIIGKSEKEPSYSPDEEIISDDEKPEISRDKENK